MDDAVHLISRLKSGDPSNLHEEILNQLIELVLELNDDGEADDSIVQETVFKSEAMDIVMDHFQSEGEDTLLSKCCQLIAELAKTEKLREPLVATEVMPHLLQHLTSSHIPLATQACRALGNICYDNDLGRSTVDKENGIPVILNVLKKLIDSSEEGAARLRIIMCGFLLNLTNNNDVLQQRAVEAGVLGLLCETVQAHLYDQDLTNMALLTLTSITEADCGKSAAGNCGLLDTCKLLLERESPENLTEMVLELLVGVMELESAKSHAASSGLCQSLVNVIQSPVDSPAVKLASDVLVSVLVGDESMDALFAHGDGPLYQQCVQWLSSHRDSLQTLGCLAIGNFARRDVYCQQLVDSSVLDQLIGILWSTVGPDASFTLQHAVLSTLRNLAIPASNKPKMICAGVMEACLTLVHSEVMAVVFKLLGVLRMLIEGQELAAVQLGQELTFLECLTDWCTVEAHAGVKGEASRVIASLVKNSKSSAVIQNLIRAEDLPHLVAMATSEHLVMQNEAIMALSIICSVALGDSAVPLREAGLSATVATLLQQESLPPEVLCNVFSLLKAVAVSGQLREDLVNNGVLDLIKIVAESHADLKVKEQASSTLNLIEESMCNG